MSRMQTRLTKLERVTSQRVLQLLESQRKATESDTRLEAAWQIMQSTMSEEHARIVVEAYAAGLQEPLGPDYHTPAARLLRRCLHALTSRPTHWPYNEIPDEVAYAMPPEVAAIYLARDELPLHECEDCGLRTAARVLRLLPALRRPYRLVRLLQQEKSRSITLNSAGGVAGRLKIRLA